MVDPCNLRARRADRDYMVHCGFHRMHDFNFHPAAWRPGFALAPANVSIDVAKPGPEAKVRKQFPRQRRTRLGKNRVLQILHYYPQTKKFIDVWDEQAGGSPRIKTKGIALRMRKCPCRGQLPARGEMTVNITTL